MPGSGQARSGVPNDQRIMLEEIWEVQNEIIDALTDIKTQFEAHTHGADGAEAGAYFTSIPKTDAADKTAGTTRTLGTVPTKMTG